MDIRLTKDKIRIKLIPVAPKTKLFLPENYSAEDTFGEVIDTGENVGDIKPGDKIGFRKYATLMPFEDSFLMEKENVIFKTI